MKMIIIILTLIVFLGLGELAYDLGKSNGCHDLIDRLNDFGVNNAKQGVGLSAWAWCDRKSI